MRITREAIARMIPHAGAMCLLDGIVDWNAGHIAAVTHTHRDPHNPLRSASGLPVLCGIEYAAQAMAVHGALTGKVAGRPRAGYLAALRDVAWRGERLDAHEGPLTIAADLVMGDETRVIYRFAVSAADGEILSGRATVVLDADAVRAA